jgi:beta-mannosidase
VASWASLDYFGRWKALHYAAKRFYAPLLLSVAEQGKSMDVHVTSDLVEPVDVLVRWRLETLDGKSLSTGEQNLRAMALADTRVGSYDFSTLVSAENQRKVVFVAEMWQNGRLVSQSVTPFVANKHIELRKPGLKVQTQVDGQVLSVTVSARYLARFVELSIDGTDAVFSDNYFDVPAGTTVTVTTPLPENWTEGSTVLARSLYDSFA